MQQPGVKREMGGRAPLAPTLATALITSTSVVSAFMLIF